MMDGSEWVIVGCTEHQIECGLDEQASVMSERFIWEHFMGGDRLICLRT
jgi:hypothetical protein